MCLCQGFVVTFFIFRNSVEKLCISWVFSLIECVAVWALKLPVPHTDVLKPTSHKAFLRNYWNLKELATNNCHISIIPNSVFVYLITAHDLSLNLHINFLIPFIFANENYALTMCAMSKFCNLV